MLLVNEIKNEEDLIAFKKSLLALCNDPFNKIIVKNSKDSNSDEKLFYFSYSENDVVKVMMPFYLRNIYINEALTSYFDVSSPYGYSGPVYIQDTSDTLLLKEFWNHVDDWYKKNNIITEFIRFSLNGNHKEYTGELIHTLKNVKGKIIDEETQWINFKPKVRNNYRRALKDELTIKIYDESNINEELITLFYTIYTNTMNRNNATKHYFYSLSFFKDFIKINHKNCAVTFVYKDDKPVSTELMIISDDIIYSFLGGTLAEYFSSRPNDFLKIEVIKWALKKGIKYYVLGGGRTDDDGLYKYKKAFFQHDEDVVFYTGRKVLNSEIYNRLIKEIEVEVEVDIIKEKTNQKFFPAYRK